MEKKMSATDVFFIVAEKNKNIKLKKDVKKVILDFVDLVNSELKRSGEFKLFNIGKFKIVEKKEKIGRNPKTGQTVKVPARKGLKFLPSKEYKVIKNGSR